MSSASSVSGELTGAKRRIIDRLKRVESATAPELAEEFGLTDTAIRQHLESLEAAHLVERTREPAVGRGRPPVHWRLTDSAAPLFADRHADLTVELIAGIREALGDAALQRVVDVRAGRQLEQYRVEMDAASTVEARLQRLADLRSSEGYLAEAVQLGGHLVLIEHHCPIRDAAEHCTHLCDAELSLFRTALGPGVSVDREQHLLDGDQRCAYRVTPA